MKNDSNMVNLSLICARSGKKVFRLSLYLSFGCLCWTVAQPLMQNEENGTKMDAGPYNDTTQSEKLYNINVSTIAWNDSNYYKAAVIEFCVSRTIDVRIDMAINLRNFVNIIAECGRDMVDIVVFPEGGIYGFFPTGRYSALLTSSYVPAADDFIVPCDHNDYNQSSLRYLSCAAKQSKTYVAVDLIEKVHSSNSSHWDGILLYNTAVVFDRNGMVIARYRKFNLYTEKWFNEVSTTDEPEHVTFSTDFGVKFGILICFDILFTEPGLELVKMHNITHFIHLSQMMSKLPFLGAASIDSGWSYALDVVVLSSTIPFPENNPGTNIYFGRRLGTSTYVKPFQRSKIIVAPVPKNLLQQTPEYPDVYDSLPKYTLGNRRQSWYLVEPIQDRMITEPIVVGNKTNASFSYEDVTFQCNISVSWKHSESFINYQFVAYSGLNNYSVASINNHAEICGISLCSKNSVSSCQMPPSFNDASKLAFLSVNISTRSAFPDAVRIPIASDSYLAALNGSNFDFDSHIEDSFGETWNHVDMKLEYPIANLMAFGVYKLPSKSHPIPNFNLVDFTLNEKKVN